MWGEGTESGGTSEATGVSGRQVLRGFVPHQGVRALFEGTEKPVVNFRGVKL